MLTKLLSLLVVIAILAVLPTFLDIGWQNAMTNMLIASLFAVSFNLLVGQAGLLSFGHAAFFGVGAFATIHLMLAVEDNLLPFPTPLLPFAGAVVGFLVGAFVGYFATMRTGVYFALVTLAIAELLHSLAPHWEGLFGGEAGLSSMRMPWGGVTYGTSLEVYYLALGWTLVCIFLLWAYTRTPFGRLTLALRDNEQRVRFMGYNAHSTKVIIFAISAMFSGVAGGLLALSNETVNYTLFSTQISAQVVLHTFVGGSTVFFGPIIGASVFTLFATFISDVTRSWLLYQGLIFVLVMLYAPNGIGGLLQSHLQHRRQLQWQEIGPSYLIVALVGVLLSSALIFVVEVCSVVFSPEYEALRRRHEGGWPGFELFGLELHPFGLLTWAIPIVLAALGFLLLPRARRRLRAVWDRILERSEAERSGSTALAGEGASPP